MRIDKKTLLRYVALGVLAVLIGTGVYSLNASHLTGNQMPMPFGYGASVVLSGSMEPALSVGDLLVVRQEASYAQGDIVVYQAGRMAVVHRITAIDGETVTTRGDANTAFDEPIAADAIKGKVVAAVPLLGYAVWALKSPVGVAATIAVAVLLVELSYRGEKAEKNAEQEKIKAEIRALMEELEQET
ncbi:MAG: signal peptidase I [Oscillospiraceae bacterium]|nr:signal peptidase I [Oscillospiraceae bacterium]